MKLVTLDEVERIPASSYFARSSQVLFSVCLAFRFLNVCCVNKCYVLSMFLEEIGKHSTDGIFSFFLPRAAQTSLAYEYLIMETVTRRTTLL